MKPFILMFWSRLKQKQMKVRLILQNKMDFVVLKLLVNISGMGLFFLFLFVIVNILPCFKVHWENIF